MIAGTIVILRDQIKFVRVGICDPRGKEISWDEAAVFNLIYMVMC